MRHQGRYWSEKKLGFYATVHLLARLSPSQATRPTAFSWGFRATLNIGGTAGANSFVPVHLLADIEHYEYASLPKRRQRNLRACLAQVNIVELTGPRLLREQGWEVMSSSLQRVSNTVSFKGELPFGSR